MKKGLRAELTVEAAVVMSVVLFSVMGLILFDFELHDKLAAANRLICAVEMYSHRNKSAVWADDYWKTVEDTDIYIMGKGQTVQLETLLLPWGRAGSVSYGETTWTINNRHVHPEDFLRLSTLSELTKKLKKTKKDGDADTNTNTNTNTSTKETGK